MVPCKRLDVSKIISAALLDAQMRHGDYFGKRALRLTLNKVNQRLQSEGIGFVTKSLPNLGKALDRALSTGQPLNVSKLGFKTQHGSSLPKFLGELFQQVFDQTGNILSTPNATCVRTLRQIFGLFYKYKLPYTDDQEDSVIASFKEAEQDLVALNEEFTRKYEKLQEIHLRRSKSAFGGELNHSIVSTVPLQSHPAGYCCLAGLVGEDVELAIIDRARTLLERVFSDFDPMDIYPKHGPGAVAQKQRYSEKYIWTDVPESLTAVYPLDAYFFASYGHVCDKGNDPFAGIGTGPLSARVCLVAKDSRGPRLISCEPAAYQWIQQGMMSAIVQHIESHPLTKGFVNFTDQTVNQRLALKGSIDGSLATLDLKEASDRVHLDLVRLIFPERIYSSLAAMRSQSTVLPSGEVQKLQKFAPMGSAVCFPVLALTIWALLYSGTANADTRKSIYVYGDDVIVPTAYAESAMTSLPRFGLKFNQSKCCTHGFFRESCGVDAFQGIDVTPVRLRTLWTTRPSAGAYESWISYANSFYDRGDWNTYWAIVDHLTEVYGDIPDERPGITPGSYPALRLAADDGRKCRTRYNSNLQRQERFVRVTLPVTIVDHAHGWIRLLRYLSTVGRPDADHTSDRSPLDCSNGLSDTSMYTLHRRVKMRRQWR